MHMMQKRLDARYTMQIHDTMKLSPAGSDASDTLTQQSCKCQRKLYSRRYL